MSGTATPLQVEHLNEIALLAAAELGGSLTPDATGDVITVIAQIAAINTLLGDVRTGVITGHPHNEIALKVMDSYWTPVVDDLTTSDDGSDVSKADLGRAREVRDAIRSALNQYAAARRQRGDLRRWRVLNCAQRDAMVLDALGGDCLPTWPLKTRIYLAHEDLTSVNDVSLRRHLKSMAERGLLAETWGRTDKGRRARAWVAISGEVAQGFAELDAFLREHDARREGE
jgi:hypothetical protein